MNNQEAPAKAPSPGSPPAPLRHRWISGIVLALVLLLCGGVLLRLQRLQIEAGPGGVAFSQVVDLATLPWTDADTGWLSIGYPGTPVINKSFGDQPIVIAGSRYEAGIGTYPQSEISYRLDGAYARFRAQIGVDDLSAGERGDSRFLVFGDDLLLSDSGVLKKGEVARSVSVLLNGVAELRLVTIDESPDQRPGFTDWVEPELTRGVAIDILGFRLGQVFSGGVRQAVEAAAAPLMGEIDSGLRRAQEGIAFFSRPSGGGNGDVGAVQGVNDDQHSRYVMTNSRLTVYLGFGGPANATLTVLDRSSEAVVLSGASSITLPNGRRFNLARDAQPEEGAAPAFKALNDPALGPGLSITVRFRVPDAGVRAEVETQLFDQGSYLLYQVRVLDVAGTPQQVSFDLLDEASTQLALEGPASALSDFGRLRQVRIRPDGLAHEEYLGEGRPLFIWSTDVARSVVIAAVEETAGPARAKVQMPTGSGNTRVGLKTSGAVGFEGIQSPRLYLEFPETVNPIDALANFRRLTTGLYPAAELPSWFRYQWNSWYTDFMGVTDHEIRRQADYIDAALGDLGPWNIAIDAGWYVAGGRPEGDWRNIDWEKFPYGIGPLVQYLKDRDIQTILYVTGPYVDNRPDEDNWRGLAGIIRDHSEWLIPVDSDAEGQGYLYDFTNSGFQDYIRSLIEDFFVNYGVDGMEIDGLGTVPMPMATPHLRDEFGVVAVAADQTMEAYRLIHNTVMQYRPDAYLMAGWHFPLYANPYAHAFWYCDELPAFSSPYPYGGLVEHIDYAIVQQGMWGQRSHMGFPYGDPNTAIIPRWWLEAAIALGTQVSLGFDMSSMEPETLSRYRELLNHYRPNRGQMFVVGTLPASVFGSHRDGFTYLGVLNRETDSREVRVRLKDIGLSDSDEFVALDVERDRYMRVSGEVRVIVPPGSFKLMVIKAEPGVIWSNSSYETEVSGDEVRVTVRGPDAIEGFVDVNAPLLGAVIVDGQNIPLDRVGNPGVTAAYDRASRVVRVSYPHDRPHDVRVLLRSAT